MTKEIFRKKIDDAVLDGIRKRICDYLKQSGVSNVDVISRCMIDNVKALYVENLLETRNFRMVHRKNPPEIAIDKSFCRFDNNNNFIGFDPNLSKLIESQLGHELLHAASARENPRRSGIMTDGSERGLNEGFTQLITENIFGYVVSVNSDHYYFFKKYAKILEATFGKRFILESYLNDSKPLKERLDAIFPDYYRSINSRLTHAYFGAKIGVNLDNYYETLSKDIILNVVIPEIKSKSPEDANKYLKNICLYFSDDYEFATKFIEMIETYLKMSNEQLSLESSKVTQRCYDMTVKLYLYEQCEKSADILSIINVTPDGRIIGTYENKQYYLTDEKAIEMIYDKIFKTKYASKESISQYEQRIIFSLTSGNYVINFSKKSNSDILYKRAVLALYKRVARENNFIILNNISDVDNNSSINLKVIKIDEKKSQFNFRDLSQYIEEYDFRYTSNTSYEIISKKDGKRVMDPTIINLVSFAYLWLSSFGVRWRKDENIPGALSAFNEFSEEIYNEFCNAIYNSIKHTGNIDVNTLAQKLKGNRSFSSVYGPLSIMFANPISTQIVYKYFDSLMPREDKKLQTEPTKLFDSEVDYQIVVESSVDTLIPSRNKSIYEEYLNNASISNIPGHSMKSRFDLYQLFVSVADSVANAISIENEVVAATNMNKVLELEYNLFTIDVSKINFDESPLDQKIQYCMYHMSHALRRKDINTYNHYRERYFNVINDKKGNLSY